MLPNIKSNLLEKYKLLLLVPLLGFRLAYGQSNFHVSARSSALALNVATVNDVGNASLNPAVLSSQKRILFCLQNASNTYTREIQKNGLVAVLPIPRGVVGFSIQNFGNKVYTLLSGGISYAMLLSEALRVGVYLGNKNYSIEQYGARSNIDLTLALQGKITDRLTYGMTLQSIRNPSVAIQSIVPTVLCTGIKYVSPLPKWNLYAEIEKSLLTSMRLKIACEYYISPIFCFRTGWVSHAYQVSAGFGSWVKKKCRIDVGSTWQPILGVSMQFGVLLATKSLENCEE